MTTYMLLTELPKLDRSDGTVPQLPAISRSDENSALLQKAPRRNARAIVAIVCLSNMFAWSCLSLIAPFFPLVAGKKGMSETIVGVVYSCPQVVVIITSPFFARILMRPGPKFYYITGLFVFASCTVMFGFLDQSPPAVPFIAITFCVRIIGSVGTSACMTASFSIVGNVYPDKIGTVYALLEMVTGVGFLIGPAVGGVLNQIGGFGLPFWVFSGIVYLFCVISLVILPNDPNYDHNRSGAVPSSLSLIRNSRVLFGSSCLIVSLGGISSWAPVLSEYLQQFELSQSLIGLIFVLPAATYSVATPIWGCLLDRNVPPRLVMLVGLLCGAISMLLLGPAPFLTFLSPKLWLVILSISLTGLTLAPPVVAAMRTIVDGARELGFRDDGNTFGLVGGVVQSSNCFGLFVGPLLGGALTQQFGFGWMTTVMAFILLIPIVIFCPIFVARERRNRNLTYSVL